MNLLNVEASQEWITTRNFRFSSNDFKQSEYLYPHSSHHRIRFTVPRNPLPLANLASILIDFLAHDELLFWASKWSFFYPEQPDDYCNFRSEVENTLLEKPCSLFDLRSPHERGLLRINTYLFLSYNWEGFLVSTDSNRVLWLADEIVEIWSSEVFSEQALEPLLNQGCEFF